MIVRFGHHQECQISFKDNVRQLFMVSSRHRGEVPSDRATSAYVKLMSKLISRLLLSEWKVLMIFPSFGKTWTGFFNTLLYRLPSYWLWWEFIQTGLPLLDTIKWAISLQKRYAHSIHFPYNLVKISGAPPPCHYWHCDCGPHPDHQ